MKLKIVTYPNKILRTKLEEVKNFQDEELNSIIKEMTRLMLKYDGVGLAANQAGINKKIVIIEFDKKAEVFINPKITKRSFLKQESNEGCLSFPEINGIVNRPKSLTLKYQNTKGEKKVLKTSGFYTTVFSHEIDHINGIVFTDKIKKFTTGEDIFKKLQEGAAKNER